nr:hypothetical protein [uncultured Dyadobacter sp.]
MKNLLIIDQRPLLRLGLRLIVESNLPAVKCYEVSCRNTAFDPLSKIDMSVTFLGFDTDKEPVNMADIVTIGNQFPQTKLVIYAGDVSTSELKKFQSMNIAACIHKQDSIEKIVECISRLM